MKPEIYTYVYYDPETLQPFLVGKGSGQRAYDHLKEEFHETKNFHKWAKIESLKKKNLKPIIKLFYFETEEEAYNLEEFLTHHWGIDPEGGILTNIIHGGRGGWKGVLKSESHKRKIGESNKIASQNPKTKERRRKIFLGKKHTEETKNKIRQAHLGMKASEETKQKLREMRQGEKHPMFGKHHTQESKEKNRQWHLGRKMPESMSEKMRIIQTGTKRSQETKNKMSLSAAKRFPFNWEIIHPDGHKEIVTNLNGFCKQHKLASSNFINHGHTKGYKAKKINISTP